MTVATLRHRLWQPWPLCSHNALFFCSLQIPFTFLPAVTFNWSSHLIRCRALYLSISATWSSYSSYRWLSLLWNVSIVILSAGRYTGSYRIPVFIFLTIWIFKIPQYRCHLNNVWNATLLERGLFSLLHFGEDTAVCVTKRESSETEALVECEEREEVIHNIHIDRHKYPPSAASAPASLTN